MNNQFLLSKKSKNKYIVNFISKLFYMNKKSSKQIEQFNIKGISESNVLNIYAILHLILAMLAVAVSIKCDGEFRLVPVLVAILCPHFFLIFALATKGVSLCFGSEE